MNIPADLKYTKEHEWVRINDDGTCVIGITDFAQGELGDIVFVEFPDVGAGINAGESFGVAESVKTVSDLYAPLSCSVLEVNSAIDDAPELVNKDPYGEGWLIKVKPDNPADLDSLLSADEYRKLI